MSATLLFTVRGDGSLIPLCSPIKKVRRTNPFCSDGTVSVARVHRIRVPVGHTVSLRPGAVGYPLTVTCAQPPYGLTQFLRVAPRAGTTAIYGDGQGHRSIRITMTTSGVTRISCS